ncbi:YqaJ viral recombinase family protein [Burkholderia cenocepacia]|uniref:lambda exonuclease family protein n=1 Tax=Burkholderia cenocepacia TaxID=95486 RepID=UPI0023B9725D|nr:lambda exonuclease family protein [Burkholderia cenocepacia]MDF0506585.1 YqaJ viral recombinase family protein [Burkholderia cenocepacia]
MIIVECQQGTPEWLAARAGVITASNFRIARTRRPDGRTLSDTARHLAFRLAIERISGVPLDDDAPETWQMKRGQRLEDDARTLHMAEIGLRVRPVGIVLTDDRKFGASADGWIEDPRLGSGGAEYKCLIGPKELEAVYIDDDATKYIDQVQGNMWLSGREWWDFCVYCPALESIGLHFYRQRIKRDDDYIEQLVSDLWAFDSVVEEFREKLLIRQARREGREYTPAEAFADADL